MSPHFRRVWRAPVAIGVLTLVGLISALLGDGAWDWVSAAALAVPALLCAWHCLPRRRSGGED